jgi:hypothetical protein
MAQPTNKQPPIRRRDPWDFRPWKPGELRRPSTGSAASDVYPHLPSAAQPSSVAPTRRELPVKADKRWGS